MRHEQSRYPRPDEARDVNQALDQGLLALHWSSEECSALTVDGSMYTDIPIELYLAFLDELVP